MKISDLAQRLGISRQMAYKLKARGMPCDSLESAIEWRRRNLDITQTKQWRIDGNKGIKSKPVQVNKYLLYDDKEFLNELDESILNQFNREAEKKIISKVLTHIVPDLWFSQIHRLGAALREHDVNVSAADLVKIQHLLFLLYMIEVDRHLQTEVKYYLPPILMLQPNDEAYSSLIALLNQTMNKEKTL